MNCSCETCDRLPTINNSGNPIAGTDPGGALAQCDGNFTTKTQRTRSCLGSHLKIQVIEDPLWGLCYNIEAEWDGAKIGGLGYVFADPFDSVFAPYTLT
jgi:hypothetical protein